jgi:Carboxypeptidase regulatory-like domain
MLALRLRESKVTRARFLRAWLVCGIVAGCFAALGRGQQADSDKYEVRGKVVNAVSGAPISNALVILALPQAQVQFSDADGTFAFAGVPAGTYFWFVWKPGYFSERDLGSPSEEPTARKRCLRMATRSWN